MEKKNKAFAVALCGVGVAIGCTCFCTPLKASAYSGGDGVNIYPQKYTWFTGAELVNTHILSSGEIVGESSLPMPNCIFKNTEYPEEDIYTNKYDITDYPYEDYADVILNDSNKMYINTYSTAIEIKKFTTTITTVPNQIVTQSFFDSIGRTSIYINGAGAPNAPYQISETISSKKLRARILTMRLELWNYTTNTYDTHILSWDESETESGKYTLAISSQEKQIPNIQQYRRIIEGTRFYNLRTCELAVQLNYSEDIVGGSIPFITIYHDTNPAGATVGQVMHVQRKYIPPTIAWDGKIPLFNVVESFFETEIFPGFSFGTVLLFGIGAFIVGIVLKVFLGG